MENRYRGYTIGLSVLSLALIIAVCAETIQIGRLNNRLELLKALPASGQLGPIGAPFETENDLFLPFGFSPRLDLRDEGENFVVRVDLPGVDHSLIATTVKDRVLTISGKRDEVSEEKSEEGKVIHSDRSFGSFERVVTLPEAVNEGAVETEYNNGVLEITIPKASKEEPANSMVPIGWDG